MLEEKKQFAERLNIALDKAGIPPKGKGRQTKIAALFNVSQESARKWLEGETFPGVKRISEFARTLHVNAQWLLSGVGAFEPGNTFIPSGANELQPLFRRVPMLTWQEAGDWKNVIPRIAAREAVDYVWADMELSLNAYALRVRDDGLMPRFEQNTILVVEPDAEPQNKQLVLYLLDGTKEVMCKQLITDGKYCYLKPLDPHFPVITLTVGDIYCGVVRQARIKY